MVDVDASFKTYQEFRTRILVFMTRVETLLRPDSKMKVVKTWEEDDNVTFRFRFSHSITLSVSVAVVDYASLGVHGGSCHERRDAGLSNLAGDEGYGEKGNFAISLEEEGAGSSIITPFRITDDWLEFSDMSGWERRFALVESMDVQLAEAITQWFEGKRQEANAQRQIRLSRRKPRSF